MEPLYRRIPVQSKYLSANFVCPFCGGRIRYPGSKEKLIEYASEGLLDVRTETMDVMTQYVPTAQSFWRATSLWVLSLMVTAPLVAHEDLSPWIGGAILGLGAMGVCLYSFRTKTVVAPVEESDEPPEPMQVEATVRTLGGVGKLWYAAPCYEKSGRQIPDYKVWQIFDAYLHGTAFSVGGMAPVAGRPAFEAVRNDFVRRGLAYVDGQDVQVMAAGKAVMREWVSHDRPPMVMERGETRIERSKS